MLNDLFLLAQIKEGNIKAFEQIFRQYYTPLCLYATGITGQKEVAEEIVQELFYIFWKEKGKILLFHSIKSYLYRAVRNQSLLFCEHQEVRNRYREMILSRSEQVVPGTDPQQQIEYKELEELIGRTLRKLPKRCRLIFKMHRFEGKKYAEIASELSLSVKTIEAEMTKALRTLRKETDKYTKND